MTPVHDSSAVRYTPDIDGAIRARLDGTGVDKTLTGMMAYQLGYVDESLRPATGNGGKRFRPGLCLLSCAAVGGNPSDALSASTGIELLHNFSLIHDDIEDRDPVRRHRPALWKVWGEAMAINAGDCMISLASQVMSEAGRSGEISLRLTQEFHRTCLALTHGQHLDMSFESRTDVSTAEYLEMISLKTASLIGFSLWSGAFIGGADRDTAEVLRNFGIHLGYAFQIRDDLHGIWGSQDRTGKLITKDLDNRKKTLPILLAWQGAESHQQKLLRRFFVRESNDLPGVLRVLDATEARSRSRSVIEKYVRSAIEALGKISISVERRTELVDLARELTE